MSRLLDNSDDFRQREKARNEYTNNDEYVAGHPNALSDGDEKGKGATDTVGGTTDIAKRNESKARNIYDNNNPYNINNA